MMMDNLLNDGKLVLVVDDDASKTNESSSSHKEPTSYANIMNDVSTTTKVNFYFLEYSVPVDADFDVGITIALVEEDNNWFKICFMDTLLAKEGGDVEDNIKEAEHVMEDSDNDEVDHVYDETKNFMASGGVNDTSLLEDKEYDIYDTYDLDGLTKVLLHFVRRMILFMTLMILMV
ncbi:hypothetical protein Tco_0897293 [Tanacetum coccineum]